MLQEIGVDFLHDEAKAMLKEAGADVDPASNRVRFDPALVEAQIGKAPRQFTLHARNPERSVVIGGAHVAFCSVASAPNSFDREGGRRPGNQRDYQNFIRLGQSFNSIHVLGGYPVEPIDIHASVRHLDALFDMLTLSDKPIHAYSLGRERNLDAIEMAKIARGIDDATLEREPSLFTIINSSSPLRLDTPMLEGVIQMARRNQVVVLTPFTLAGAMAPVTLAGALAQQHAEALAGFVIAQVVRPGSPFVYGGFTSNVDMKSGAPAFGTPEYMKTAIVGGQLARRLVSALSFVQHQRRQFARRPGGLRERVLAVGRDHGRRQSDDARRGLDGRRIAGFVREDGARRRPAGDGRRVPAAAARRRRRTGARGDARGRPRRAFLRRGAYPGALSHRLLPADDLGLAQLRDLARGGLADRL